MKRFLITALLLFAITCPSIAEQVIIRHVNELVERADLIARASVICVVNKDIKEGYSKIAYLKITDPIRATEKDIIVALENDVRDVACPNVRYVLGEDVLIFAKRMANGNYNTVYADAGKFLIENESVNKRPFKEHQSYRNARAEIKRVCSGC